MPKYYLTTPIYYVNDVPHLGHAYTTIAADALARYKRLTGFEVMFLTGTDEHGQKVQRAAQEAGEQPIQLADRMVGQFQALWRRLNISNDDFIRTTEERHIKACQAFWNKLWEKDDIYLGQYEGWYCTPCETFWPQTQLLEGNLCPDCNRPTEKLKEESFFFRMSKYQDELLKYIEENPNFIQPPTRRNEIISFVKSGLKDLSVSRTSFDWGIPIPQNQKHVMYVWVDALANYITAQGYLDDPQKFQHYWPADVHIIGKDILRFHAVYWPTMLMAAGIELPKMVFGHGWWTVEGRKMSKSVRNVVEPHRLIDEFGADPIRYFVLREVPFGLDGDFSRAALINRINSDLANDLGNLLSRTLTMVHRYCGGQIPAVSANYDDSLVEGAKNMIAQVEESLAFLAFNTALIHIWDYIGTINKYVDQKAPWMMAKDEKRKNEVEIVLYNSLEALRMVALMVYSFMPQSAQKMWEQLGLKGNLSKVRLRDEKEWSRLQAGISVQKSEALFPRLEGVSTEVVIEEETVGAGPRACPKTGQPSRQGGTPTSTLPSQITIEDFGRMDLRVAQIKTAEAVKGSNKLIKMQVDLGFETRQVVAGIAQSYKPEELVGKKVILVANLKPAKLMGLESKGMVLAAGEAADKLALVTPEKDAPLGSKVK
jgi:methionyl-tRNA synthetase